MRVLVLAAHPDDETIGAGGTIARLAADGAHVHLYVATRVYPPRWTAEDVRHRQDQAEKAAAVLGVNEVSFGPFHTMHLAATPAIELSSAVTALVRDTKPDIVLAPPLDDINSDHSALFSAALVAARTLADSTVRSLYAYEISTTTRFCGPGPIFSPNTYVDITDTFDTKLAAMKAYESELREYPHPRSVEGLEILARERGLACDARYAEGLLLIRRSLASDSAVAL